MNQYYARRIKESFDLARERLDQKHPHVMHYDHIVKRYMEPHRKYHTLEHIKNTLNIAEKIITIDYNWLLDIVDPCIEALIWHDDQAAWHLDRILDNRGA